MSFSRDNISFGFDTSILLDAKICSVPQYIGASLHKFETTDLGIKLPVSLAPDGWVNLSDTLVLAIESFHHLQPPHTKKYPRCSKCIWVVNHSDILRDWRDHFKLNIDDIISN